MSVVALLLVMQLWVLALVAQVLALLICLNMEMLEVTIDCTGVGEGLSRVGVSKTDRHVMSVMRVILPSLRATKLHLDVCAVDLSTSFRAMLRRVNLKDDGGVGRQVLLRQEH
jgi:hypothetical protein